MSGETEMIERQIVRKLIRTLRAKGFHASEVFSGGEYEKVRTEKEVLDAVFSGDASTIHFDAGLNGRERGNSHGVLIVCGNGFDCLSDWHIGNRAFDECVGNVAGWIANLETYK